MIILTIPTLIEGLLILSSMLSFVYITISLNSYNHPKR